MSKLFLRYAAMNAGKSTQLLQVAHNYDERGMKVVLYTARLDDRAGVGLIASRLGVTRPYARLGLLHNHEEPWPAVRHQLGGALLGVGDGIRHRTGLEAGLGIDIPVWRRARWELVVTIEANASWLTYSTGPDWYWGGGLGFGFHYAL